MYTAANYIEGIGNVHVCKWRRDLLSKALVLVLYVGTGTCCTALMTYDVEACLYCVILSTCGFVATCKPGHKRNYPWVVHIRYFLWSCV